MTTPYTNAEVVRQGMNKTGTGDDAVITRIIFAVSQLIERETNRPDGFVAADTASAKLFSGSGSGVLYIPEAALLTSVGVKASPTDNAFVAWEADQWLGFSGDAAAPDFNRTPYTGILAAAGTGLYFTGGGNEDWAWGGGRRGLSSSRSRRTAFPTVQVTARWGYALTVPPAIEQVCIIETTRIFKRGESAFADTLASADLGKLLYTTKLDPSSKAILEDGRFIRPAVG